MEWMALEEQERLLDEEERMEAEACPGKAATTGSSNMAAANFTICLPDMADFARMAKTSSTPFTGWSRPALCIPSSSHVGIQFFLVYFKSSSGVFRLVVMETVWRYFYLFNTEILDTVPVYIPFKLVLVYNVNCKN